MKAAILTDLTKCIGCEACVLACKEINDNPKHTDTHILSAQTWSALEHRKGVNIRRHCMHCLEPACVSACPVLALVKTESGAVVYDADACMGCRYCMIACPFGIPKYEWDRTVPRVQKCILCYEKALQKGEQPACTKACPTGATIFGDRDELIKVAKHSIDAEPEKYHPHIYGIKEAGGTSVLYLSPVPFSELGFARLSQDDPYPRLTWNVLSKIPNIVGTGGVLLFGIWWIINRRITLENQHESDEDEILSS
ncbi:4Fe-4S dicluster domain-containing protein [candidate division KSB1 bacterium]|nr:4Fe-4S dicluster domain-containing protein [candidate division KSB1 bacterium]